jgi:phosphoglycolate phosphatase-like HAD superfamily hydrolase
MKTALIFDVDGTLLQSEHLDEKYFIQAVTDVLGSVFFEEHWNNYTKVTDLGIIKEILEKNSLPVSIETVAGIRERFEVLIRSYLDRGGICREIPGAGRLLKKIVRLPGYRVGIATGGGRKTAIMKLTAAEIDINGMPITTSDDSDDRTEIMRMCLDRMEGPFSAIAYIGDGLWDHDACKKLRWEFIGIGNKLKGKCDVWFEDLRNIDAILKVLP